jgi:hypothetical protein
MNLGKRRRGLMPNPDHDKFGPAMTIILKIDPKAV